MASDGQSEVVKLARELERQLARRRSLKRKMRAVSTEILLMAEAASVGLPVRGPEPSAWLEELVGHLLPEELEASASIKGALEGANGDTDD